MFKKTHSVAGRNKSELQTGNKALQTISTQPPDPPITFSTAAFCPGDFNGWSPSRSPTYK